MFSYGGQHEDELCFETGDIITLISKVNFVIFIKIIDRDIFKTVMKYYLCWYEFDIMSIFQDEEAWWKGATADGRTGVFPSNYVELIECKY